MEKQLDKLNCFRKDFKKWACSNEPSTWELDVNKINGHIDGFIIDDDPIILLDCFKSEGDWYLCVNENNNSDVCCYPIEELTKEQVYDIRRIVETWLARKELDSFNF
jgi:hypothetical protein